MKNESPTETLLAFWFGTAADNATVAQQQASLWWSKSDEIDRDIRERFEGLFQQVVSGAFEGWPETSRGRLAKIILLDQLPRNMYRGTPAAFAHDALARQLARTALEQGDEAHLRPIERVFLYMPFEHAEDPALQELAVERFTTLCNLVAPAVRGVFKGFLYFAVRHRDIIRRFGRFPHRNALLGRVSTAAESEFLKQPGSSFY